jgi:hypothetical protein
MNHTDLDLDLEELSSAEDFLDYFGIDYDPTVVHVNRLHILQRFHDYLGQAEGRPADPETRGTGARGPGPAQRARRSVAADHVRPAIHPWGDRVLGGRGGGGHRGRAR